MRVASLTELIDWLGRMPLMVKMNPLSAAFLPDDVCIYENAQQMVTILDDPAPQPAKRMLMIGSEPALQHRLPTITCDHDPLTTEMNRVLLKRYDWIKNHLLCQSRIADIITQHAEREAIVLMLIDGLSYSDIKRYAPRWLDYTTPVLVDGVTITEQGMTRLVGNPPLAQRLFDSGFQNIAGFTYWERSEDPLTNRIFSGFGNRVYKVKSFDDVLQALEDMEWHGAFVQIVRTGLDGVAHRQREAPNVAAIVGDILNDFERLINLLECKGVSAQLHLVSDHGILWAHEHTLQPYEFSGADHPRHYTNPRHDQHTLTVEFEGKGFALLEYPYLRRDLRTTEWGVHGGLSFEESIVPLIRISTG